MPLLPEAQQHCGRARRRQRNARYQCSLVGILVRMSSYNGRTQNSLGEREKLHMLDLPLRRSKVPGYPCRHGKVRDIYDLGDRLIIVATDRISAFDWVLPTAIPDKGRVLTQLTLFWLKYLHVRNHLLSTNLADMPSNFASQKQLL